MQNSLRPHGALRALALAVLIVLVLSSILIMVPRFTSWSTAFSSGIGYVVSLGIVLFFALLTTSSVVHQGPWFLTTTFLLWVLGRLLVHAEPFVRGAVPAAAPTLSIIASVFFGLQPLALAYVIFRVFSGPSSPDEPRPTLASGTLAIEAVEAGLAIRLALIAASIVAFYRPLQFTGGGYYDGLRLLGGLLLYGGLVWLGTRALREPPVFPTIAAFSYFLVLSFLVITPVGSIMRFVPSLASLPLLVVPVRVLSQLTTVAWYVLAYLVASPTWIDYYTRR